MNWFHALILAIIEGLTEFLPVSSTGHMALAASFLDIEQEQFTKLFIENIQFGTILSVLVLYWRRFLNFKNFSFYLKLLIAFIPAAIVGVLLKDHIDKALGNPLFIAIVMVAGGVVLIFVDNWFRKPVIESEEKISGKNALFIGLFQILAVVFPGLSRSAATIIGGMQQKLTRNAAAEFSFFLAVPTLAGAFAKSLYDTYKDAPQLLSSENIKILAFGNVIGFIVAILAIKLFINFLTKHGFRLFGYYRIIVGTIIIILILSGFQLGVI